MRVHHTPPVVVQVLAFAVVIGFRKRGRVEAGPVFVRT